MGLWHPSLQQTQGSSQKRDNDQLQGIVIDKSNQLIAFDNTKARSIQKNKGNKFKLRKLKTLLKDNPTINRRTR